MRFGGTKAPSSSGLLLYVNGEWGYISNWSVCDTEIWLVAGSFGGGSFLGINLISNTKLILPP